MTEVMIDVVTCGTQRIINIKDNNGYVPLWTPNNETIKIPEGWCKLNVSFNNKKEEVLLCKQCNSFLDKIVCAWLGYGTYNIMNNEVKNE